MSSLPSSSPFDDLLRELDELPTPSSPQPRDQNKEIALQKLMDASKLLEAVAASLDPSDPKHPLHEVTLPEEAKRRLQSIVQRLVGIQQRLNTIEGEILGEEPTPSPATPSAQDSDPLPTMEKTPQEQNTAPVTSNSSPTPTPLVPPAPASASLVPSAAYLAAKKKLEEERSAFDAYKRQWEEVFTTDPTQRDAHPEVLAYYKQMDQYFIDHEKYIQTL